MKRGYLGLIEGAYLAGRSAGHIECLQEHGITPSNNSIPVDKMIYVAGFQGGIEQFITPIKQDINGPVDNFLLNRISAPKIYHPEILMKLIDISNSTLGGCKDIKAITVLPFLHDLIVAMSNNAAVINITGIPSQETIKRYFPPDLAMPICNIISSLKFTEELLPAPTQTISTDGINKFNELLSSGVYSHYASAHEEIEFSSDDKAIYEIRRQGKKLLAKGKGILFNRRVSISILSVVPKVIDAAFGKLPGIVAQTAGDIADKFISERKNVVIYKFDDWVNEYNMASVQHALFSSVEHGGSNLQVDVDNAYP